MAAPSTTPKKKRKGKAGPPTFPIVDLADLYQIRLFTEIPKKDLPLLEGKVRRASAEANETIIEFSNEDEFFHHFFFVSKGQVKIVGLDEEARRRTLNFLRKGEFFVDKAIAWRGLVSTKVIAITEVELLVIHRDDLKLLSKKFPGFDKKLREISDRIDHRNRIYCEDKHSRSVLDFLVDTGLTQASRIKITRMDKCIECDTCYDSCQDRHGFQRIERGFAKFGVLDIAKSCLTCFYPTCIPSCPVDSVVYNSQSGEVEILDDCIGCQACARACQYGAIKMYKNEEDNPRHERFLAPDRKIKPKFIADKCNHCYGFEDLACVSNCPTGAIFEVDASELLENPTLFGAGEGAEPMPSLIEHDSVVDFLQLFYVTSFFALTAYLTWEYFVITTWPGLSFLMALQQRGLIPANFHLTFNQGSDLCIFLGNVGFSFILVAMLYPLRKAFPKLFKYAGKKLVWLDIHNFSGLIGTVLVTFHSGFTLLTPLATSALFALYFVMLSGMFGRFLFMMIPRGVAGTELQIKDIEEQDKVLSQKLDAILEDSEKHKKIVDQIVASTIADAEGKASIWKLFKSAVLTQILLWKLRLSLPQELKQYQRQINLLFHLIKQKVKLKRNVVFLEFSSRLFIKWQYVHKPVAYIMSLLAIGHVIYNLLFFKWNA